MIIMNELVSIIIPMYNAQAYIDECLKSVLNQTYSEIEVIVIDDGSIDNSSIIVEKYCGNDNRITFLKQKNQGVSVARNLGLKKARGNYIAFVDADDYLNADYIMTLMQPFKESSDIDIVVSNYTPFGERARFEHYNMIQESETVSDFDIILQDCINAVIYVNNPFAKIYKKRVLDNLQYDNMRYAEDAMFNRKAFLNSSKIIKLQYSGYNYRINMSGASHNVNNFKRNCLENIKLDKYTFDLIDNESTKILDVSQLEWQIIWDALGICMGDIRYNSFWTTLSQIVCPRKIVLNRHEYKAVKWALAKAKSGGFSYDFTGLKSRIGLWILNRIYNGQRGIVDE